MSFVLFDNKNGKKEIVTLFQFIIIILFDRSATKKYYVKFFLSRNVIGQSSRRTFSE